MAHALLRYGPKLRRPRFLFTPSARLHDIKYVISRDPLPPPTPRRAAIRHAFLTTGALGLAGNCLAAQSRPSLKAASSVSSATTCISSPGVLSFVLDGYVGYFVPGGTRAVLEKDVASFQSPRRTRSPERRPQALRRTESP